MNTGTGNKGTGLDEHRTGDRFVHFIDWLNHKLVGSLGPPDLGPYDAVVERVGAALCPVCGRPMSEHAIDHSVHNPVLDCPVEHIPPAPHNEKLNELGYIVPGLGDAGDRLYGLV